MRVKPEDDYHKVVDNSIIDTYEGSVISDNNSFDQDDEEDGPDDNSGQQYIGAEDEDNYDSENEDASVIKLKTKISQRRYGQQWGLSAILK